MTTETEIIQELAELRKDRRRFIEKFLYIVDKKQTLVPLRLNRVQADYWANRSNADIVLKSRKHGVSTIIQGELFTDALLQPNTNVVIVAQDDDSAKLHMERVKTFWVNLPDWMRDGLELETWNEHEVCWVMRELSEGGKVVKESKSRVFGCSARTLAFGVGFDIHRLHFTEMSKYPLDAGDFYEAIIKSMPMGNRYVIESTANGEGGLFYELYQGGKEKENNLKPSFYAWWWDDEARISEGSLEVPEDIRGSLTPTAEEAALMLKNKLDIDQIRYRRYQQKMVKKLFAQECAEDDTTCFLTTGNTVFDIEKIDKMFMNTREPLMVEDGGCLKIWGPPMAGEVYVIGCDCAEGLEMGDRQAAVVLNARTLEQKATLRGSFPPIEYAQKLDRLGRYYSIAQLSVEENSIGHEVLGYLIEKYFYPKLYERHDPLRKAEPHPGWLTTKGTKGELIATLQGYIDREELTIYSKEVLDELRKYRRLADAHGQLTRMGAGPGAHDDFVIALAIACITREDAISSTAPQIPVQFWGYGKQQEEMPFPFRRAIR